MFFTTIKKLFSEHRRTRHEFDADMDEYDVIHVTGRTEYILVLFVSPVVDNKFY